MLVVDDQRYARRVAYRVLSEAGYRVFEAEDGAEALEVLYAPRATVDLVMIDVVMPLMDGVELAQHIRERWPGKRLLFTSGYSAEVLAQHGLTELDVPFLAKPYTRDEALTKVRQALDRRHRERTEDPAGRRG